MSLPTYPYPTQDSVVQAWGAEFRKILPGGFYSVHEDHLTWKFKIIVTCQNISMQESISTLSITSYVDGTDLLGRKLIELAKEVRLKMGGNNELKSLQSELQKYKEAVKHLSFQLEMAEGKSGAAVKVNEVRRLALEQAAEFVMDYGIPGSGEELEIMCDQIKRLPIHKDVRV